MALAFVRYLHLTPGGMILRELSRSVVFRVCGTASGRFTMFPGDQVGSSTRNWDGKSIPNGITGTWRPSPVKSREKRRAEPLERTRAIGQLIVGAGRKDPTHRRESALEQTLDANVKWGPIHFTEFPTRGIARTRNF